MRHSSSLRLLLAVLVLPVTARAQYSEHVEVHAVEIPAIVRDAKGEVPRDLTPADFELRENGVVQRIIGVSYAGVEETPPAGTPGTAPPTPRPKQRRGDVVIYLQQTLATTEGIRYGAQALASQVEALVRSADVEIVSDFPSLHVLSRSTSNGAELRRVLEDLAAHGRGQEQILQLRQRALQMGNLHPLKGVAGPGTTAEALDAFEEQIIIRRAQKDFMSWMLRYPRIDDRANRTLILVSDGFEYDSSFYDQLFKTTDNPDVTHESAYPARDQDTLSRSLAAEGWSVYALAPGLRAMSATGIVENRSSLREKMPFRQSLVEHTLDPLNSLAAETGGLVEVDRTKVGSDLAALSARVIITYQAKGPRDDTLRRIGIRALRPGLRIIATKWSATGTPEAVTTARAISLAEGRDEPGDLPVTCGVKFGEGGAESLAVRIDLSPLDALRGGMHSSTLRVSIAVAPGGHTLPFTMLQRMAPLDLATHSHWELTFPLNGRHGAPVAAAVEEPSSGAWGGSRCVTD